MEKLKRNSNIELLRIVLMLMVVSLHFNNGEMGGAFNFNEVASFNVFPFYFLESFSVCAVNCFMIISGYYLVGNKKVKLGKIVDLLLIVVFYRLFDYVLMLVIGNVPFELKKLLVRLLPTNYFAIFYCVCYFFSPFINKLFESTAENLHRKFVFSLMVIFVLWPTLMDVGQDFLHIDLSGISPVIIQGNGGGYTLVQFFVDFILGFYLRKTGFSLKSWVLSIIFIFSTFIMTLFSRKIPSLYNYCSLLTVVNGVCLFLLFLKIDFKSRTINFISKSVFPIFCIHTLPIANILWRRFFITEEHLTVNLGSSLLWCFISIFVMFFICLFVDTVFRLTIGFAKNKICENLPVIFEMD